MGVPKTLGAATVVVGKPTPAIFAAAGTPFTVYTISSVAYANGILTVTLSVPLPAGNFMPNNQVIAGGVAPGPNEAGAQQVILWGLSTYLDLNGQMVTVRSNPSPTSFSIYYSNPNAYSGSDTGKCAPAPFQHYRAIRIEAGQGNGADFVYVGDNHVSSTQYVAALSLAGQLAIEISSDNIPAERICINGTSNSDTCQVSYIY